jgi:hypothetical protein
MVLPRAILENIPNHPHRDVAERSFFHGMFWNTNLRKPQLLHTRGKVGAIGSSSGRGAGLTPEIEGSRWPSPGRHQEGIAGVIRVAIRGKMNSLRPAFDSHSSPVLGHPVLPLLGLLPHLDFPPVGNSSSLRRSHVSFWLDRPYT